MMLSTLKAQALGNRLRKECLDSIAMAAKFGKCLFIMNNFFVVINTCVFRSYTRGWHHHPFTRQESLEVYWIEFEVSAVP